MPTIDRRIHGIKRRTNVRAFAANAKSGSEELILKNARIFCDKLVDEPHAPNLSPSSDDKPTTSIDSIQWSSARDMSEICGYLTSDIMGDLTFNRNWNMLLSGENRWILKTLPGGVALINMVR